MNRYTSKKAAHWAIALVFCLMAGICLAADPVDVTALKGIRAVADTKVAQRCVTTLKEGMQALYGIDLPLLDAAEAEDAQNVIILGHKAVRDANVFPAARLKAAYPGGCVIDCGDGRIVIAGPDNWATLFGVYGFLDRLGLRYFTRSHRRVLNPKTKVIASFSAVERPVFPVRPGWSSELRQTTPLIADPRRALNAELFGKGSDLWIDHSAGYLVPKNLFYDQHPEYYAMLENGQRIARDAFSDHRTPLCFANPAVTRISTERAMAWVRMQPDARFFMITNGDGGWCQCPACRSMDHAPHQHARRMLLWANPICEAIAAQDPDRICITFAYGGSDLPPPDVKPTTNLWMCGSTGMGNTPFWAHAAGGGDRRFARNVGKIDDWLEAAPSHFLVCEYQSSTYKPALIDSMQARLRWYRERGVRGVLFAYGHPTNFHELWGFLFARLLWDPDQDATALADDFLKNVYGAAAPSLMRFFRLAHERYTNTINHEMNGAYPADFYASPYPERALACLAEARAAVQGKIAQRLAKEERLFVMDWMRHPISSELTPQAATQLWTQLGRLVVLAGATEGDRIAFVRSVHALGVGLELERKGSLELVEKWMQEQKLPRPKVRQEGGRVMLPAEVFLYAGLGPVTYKGGAIPCPVKTAVGIYVEGNSMRRSHKMEAAFEITALVGDGSAVLDVEATDCDHPVPPAMIRIEVNGETIYDGQVLVVKHNWSRQSFKIPVGVLKKGENVIRFLNVTDPQAVENWYERWYMLSEARVTFKGE